MFSFYCCLGLRFLFVVVLGGGGLIVFCGVLHLCFEVVVVVGFFCGVGGLCGFEVFFLILVGGLGVEMGVKA